MILKSLTKLALAATVAVSVVGLFAESTLARRARHSGDSDEATNIFAIFDIQTQSNNNLSGAVENISFADETTGDVFFQSSTGSITKRELLVGGTGEGSLQEFLNDSFGLDSSGTPNFFPSDVFVEIGGSEPVVAYEISITNSLPNNTNNTAKLTLFYDDGVPNNFTQADLNGLTTSLDRILAYEGNNTVPGLLEISGRDGIARFGVNASTPFSVEIIQDIPEPTTTAGLFLVGAFGGFSILKRNRHGNKSKVMVEN